MHAAEEKENKGMIFVSSGSRKRAMGAVHLSTDSTRGYFVNVRGKGRAKKMPVEKYFSNPVQLRAVFSPFSVIGSHESNYSAIFTVNGGGKPSQGEAVMLALARSLVKEDSNRTSLLRKEDKLTVDGRKKERNKPGRVKARKLTQFRKR